MKTTILFATFLLLTLFSKAQCEATAGPDIEIECSDTAQLNIDLYLTKEVSNTTKSLSSVHFVNHDLGFIVGQDGIILKTTDGGVSWISQVFLASEWWAGVFFINENVGYTFSYHSGKIIKTNDGGVNWSINFSSSSTYYHFRSIWFTDENHGFAVGDGGVIMSTSNGGSTWMPILSGTTVDLYDITFTNNQHGFIVGDYNTLLTTTDGGETWTLSNPYNQPMTLHNIAFVNENVGYIGGWFYLVLKTTDGGNTWTKQSGWFDKSYMGELGISLIDENTGYFCGTYAFISKTSDGGINWKNIFSKENNYYSDVYCPDNQSVFAVSAEGGIYSYHEPVSYHWEPSIGLNSIDIQNPIATPTETTTYIATVITSNGSIATDTVTVFVNPSSYVPEICIVSVDSNTNYNKIIWEKPVLSTIDSTYIYKETSTSGNYIKIGTLSTNQLSEFIDTLSNALIQSNRYKLSIVDKCSLESAKSAQHKTMHLSINQGIGNTWNLIWEQYEGFTVNTYNIYRGNTTENLNLIASLTAGNTQYTDIDAPVGTIHYKIEAVSGYSCTPTKTYNSSYSNIASYIKGNTNIPVTCLVTSDPELLFNRIIWNKPEAASVDSILIYKEDIITEEYLRIASIHQSEKSEYIDISSKPLLHPERYKLSTMDESHIESDKSTPHKTIHLAISEGISNSWNLLWNEYEGFTVISYNIFRGNSSENMQKIAILSGGNSQYSDLLAPPGDLYYQIEAESNISCNPAISYNASLSNIADHKANGISSNALEFSFVVYPNPVKSSFTVQTQERLKGCQFELVSPLGVILKTFNVANDTEYDISELPKGMYYLRIVQDFEHYYTTIVKL
jgi:photosystem II stability/assembly factor-like uncharacterized protein